MCEKKYNGENGLQIKAILCGVIPGQIKNISPNIRKKLAGTIYREKKCKCAALHGSFHRNKHFGMMEHATKTKFYDIK